jgi:predicted transcriptional regulator
MNLADAKTALGPSKDGADLTSLVAKVTAAYFSAGRLPASEIMTVIANVAGALRAVGPAQAAPEPDQPRQLPPSEVRRSITPTALISFEDGRPYTTLGRHLRARGLTPDAYRRKWGLPPDYPMVSASYSRARSALAKKMNLAEQGVQARKLRAAQAADDTERSEAA